MRVRDKTAVITGGASGIGRAAAALLAREGARVAILDRSAQLGEVAAGEIRAAGGRAASFECDVATEESVRAALDDVDRLFGPVHVLFNNAGIAVRRPVAEEEQSAWDECMAVNVRGVFLCSKYAIPRMPAGGSIINSASVVGITGVRNRAAYSATKGAIIALTRNMALDYAARGIRVNCICPGFVRTPLLDNLLRDPVRTGRLVALHPLGRLGTPEDVAQAVLFLASDESSWITGHALAVDGGFSAGHGADV